MKTVILRLARCVFAITLCLGLSACFIKPFKFDVDQGNELTAEKVEQLREGMGQDQVRYLLGSPMLNDAFHENRWDYIYIERPGYGKITRRHVVLYFHGGVIDKIVHDPVEELPR